MTSTDSVNPRAAWTVYEVPKTSTSDTIDDMTLSFDLLIIFEYVDYFLKRDTTSCCSVVSRKLTISWQCHGVFERFQNDEIVRIFISNMLHITIDTAVHIEKELYATCY